MPETRRLSAAITLCLGLALLSGCASLQPTRQPSDGSRVVEQDAGGRDETGQVATAPVAPSATVSPAVVEGVLGEGELDEVLAGTAVGAGLGAGVGAYIDRQEEKLARIPGTSVERIDEDLLLVHFDSDLLFSVNSALLNESSTESLDNAASVFAEQPKTAIVSQGHTDASGSESHNQTLSERRARSVMNYLIERGVDPERIVAVGYGERYPVADNDTPDGRDRNRRVDLLLKAKAR